MPNPPVVNTFVALVESGRFIEALHRFYHPAAIVWENQQTSRIGLDALIENEHRILNNFTMVTGRAMRVLIHADQVAINWRFEFSNGEHRTALDEIAFQQWSDGKIVHERFYYDPAQIRPRDAQSAFHDDAQESHSP
jgi:SnoaL-like polyketide cyclase.